MLKHLRRRVSVVLVVAGVALASAACGSSSTATTTTKAPSGSSTTTAPSMKTLKVALVAPSATNDLAFTESMYNALESLQASEHLQIKVSVNEFVVSDAANIIREYASQGYNLIIAHGSQYGSTIEQLAPQFPNTSFAWGTAGSTFGQPNVFAYEASSNEGGYVQGYMAALLSKSRVLGIIGPIATGDAKLYVDGFGAGAKAAAAANHFSVTAHTVYTGSFSDDSLMATAAKTFVGDGADVLTGSSQSVRRSDRRREVRQSGLVRYPMEPDDARAEKRRVVAGLQLGSGLDPDVHGDPFGQARRGNLCDRARQRR